MAIKRNLIIVIVVVMLIVFLSTAYTVDQRQQVVVTQFGKFVKSVQQPGIHFKTPFVQKLTYLDDRLLEYDSAPTEIITKDKKNLLVDNFSKWKIIDPRRFVESVRDEAGAQARLDDIIYSELRVALGLHDLSEVVSTKRATLMAAVIKSSDEKARQYGIEVVDVRIKRADLPPANERAVFGRMKAEREREAKKYRSEGEEEAAKIRAESDKERVIILATAYETEQKTKGGGDAEAVKTYAGAYQQDADFYEFLRSLDAYKKSLNSKTTLILPPDSDFLKYLRTSK